MKSSWKGRRALITGSTGYLATNLTAALKDTACRIVRLSRPGAVFPPFSGKADIEDMTGDPAERGTWERALSGVDVVFHFASQTSVQVAQADPPEDARANLVPVLRLLEACRAKKEKPLVLLAGTCTQAGLPKAAAINETAADRPVTIYDLHKLMAEMYLKQFVGMGAVRGAALRLVNVYGPGPRSRNATRGVLNQMVRRALNGEELTIYGDGGQIRDYVYVEDVVRAFLAAAECGDAVNGRHFVVGTGEGRSFAEAVQTVAARVEELTGRRPRVARVKAPADLSPIESRNYVADAAAFRRATGWAPRVSFSDGIDRTVRAFADEKGKKQ